LRKRDFLRRPPPGPGCPRCPVSLESGLRPRRVRPVRSVPCLIDRRSRTADGKQELSELGIDVVPVGNGAAWATNACARARSSCKCRNAVAGTFLLRPTVLAQGLSPPPHFNGATARRAAAGVR